MSANANKPAAVQYGKLPTAVVQAKGLVAELGQAALATYIAIAAFIDGRTWTACVSIDRIKDCAGISERTVRRSVAILVNANLLKVRGVGGRSRPTRFEPAASGLGNRPAQVRPFLEVIGAS